MTRLFIVTFVALAALAGLLFYAKAQRHTTVAKFGPGQDSKPEYMEWGVGFSADFTSKDTTDKAKNCVGRMYVNALQEPRGIRREAVCGNRKRIYIWRQQDGMMAVLDPDEKIYWKPQVESRLMPLPDKGSSRKHFGRETLNGRMVEHYAETYTQKDGSSIRAEVWEDLRLHSPLRIVTQTYTYELTNVKEGAQPELLFTIPADFRQVPPPDKE